MRRPFLKKTLLIALTLAYAIMTIPASADVNVLIIGSTHDSSEQRGGTSKPFSPTAIGTQLQSILAGSGLGSVNVIVTDRYATATTVMGSNTYAFNLASWYHWPFPKGAETARWANLRGEAGTVWDYVILIPDPYTVEYTPGLTALGAAQIAEEVAKGSAETILFMPWPASGSSRNIAHYKDVVYRAGRSGGIKVAPGGLAWQAIKGTALTNPNPNADGAFIAAASIYSTIYNQSAAASTYVYNDTWANTVNTTEANNRNAQQYTGGFSFQNPYLFRSDYERKVYFSSRGTSTESYFKDAANSAMGRCKVSVALSCPWNRSTTDWTNNGGDQPWTKWPADFVPPIAWNHGRDGVTAEWYKSYQVNPAYWDFAYGYEYQSNTWGQPVEDANDHFVSMMLPQDNMLAHRMMSEGNSARNLPVRTLWAQIHKEFPSENPLMDGSGPHLSQLEHEAVGTYMYTLYSGRCPLDPEPATLDKTWVARKIGYETAWRLGRCQMRAPGFKVMPSAATKTSITPGTTETMSVQFILPPKQDVTVNVSISNANAAIVGSQQLVFTTQNYDVPQNVVVTGLAGSAASETFSVVFTTVSTDEVYNGLSDTWDYTITRSAPVTLTRVNKTTSQVTAYQNLPVTINLNTTGAISTNTVLAGPSHGVASWSGSNVIYTPSSDFLGKDGFSFATNNAGALSVGYVEITVTSAAVNGMVSYRGNSSDGGAVPVDSNIYSQNAAVTVLGNPGTLTRIGYNFAGWNTAANGSGTNYPAGATFPMGASGMILYAKWTSVPTYAVTYNGNANTSGSVPYDQTKTDGINLTLATNIGSLGRTGYNFVGWNTAANGTGTDYAAGATYSSNANLTLYAKWNLVTYAVNYNANSATSGSTPANQIKTYGVNLTLQTNSGSLARVGYTFAGWNNRADGTGTNYVVGGNYTNNAGVTLYAKWTPGATYIVSYNANAATAGTVPVDQTKQQDVALTLATNTGGLARAGYTFAGWNTAADGTGTPYATGASYTANAAVVLYAQWAGVATYTISYNGNGNTGGSAPSNQTKNQGVALALATNSGNLTKTGFSFAGWNTATNGSGTSYAVGATYTADAAVTLYALWNALPAVNAGSDQSVTLGASVPWSPTALAPQLWLDGSTATNNAGTVSITNAGSGGGTISGPAALAAGGIGTLQAVQFNAASKYLTGDYTNTGTTLSAFFVGKSLNTTQTAYAGMMSVWANGQTSDWNNAGSSVLYNQNNATANSVQAYRSAALSSTTGILTDGFLATTVFDGTTNTAYLNGTAATAAASSGAFNAGKVVVGARLENSVFSRFWNGNFGEAIVCNANLSTIDRQKVEGYLAHKWGMAGNLATGHPHKTVPPGVTGVVATLDATATDADTFTTTWSVVSGPASVSFADASAIDTTATFTVAGVYTLRLTANDGLGQASEDIVITVNAASSNHSVTYNGNGSTGGTVPIDASSPYTNGTTITVLGNTGTLVRTGYTFNNWNTAADGTGTTYALGNTFSISAATTLYARWTPNTYAVTYNTNSATSGTIPANQTKTQDVSLTLQTNTGTLARTGYTFAGWNTLTNGLGTDYAVASAYTANSAVTLYAKWTVNTYSVTYNPNATTSGTIPSAQTKTYAVNLTLQNNTGTLARTGYTFAGWNTQADGLGTNYAVASTYTANAALVLYAKWTPNTYVVTYNANSATSGTIPSAQTKTQDINLTLQNNTGALARTGYTFAGWNTQADGLGTAYAVASAYTANAAATLYAKWSPNTYTVTYLGNGNTSGTVPASQTKTHDIDLTLDINSGSLGKTGFTFNGWNTAANGSGTAYPAGATYSGNAALTLYVQWASGNDGTWIQTASGPFNWSDTANWNGGILATGPDRTALFTPNITATQVVNLDASRTIGNITFTDSTTSSHDLTISGAGVLTLSRSSGTPVIDMTQSGRILTISSQISGSNGLQKNGAGTLTLSGANDYTGGTTLNGGTLIIGANNNMGAATTSIIVNSSSALSSSAASNVEYTRAISLGANTLTLRNTINSTTASFSGAITGAGGITVVAGGTASTVALSNTGNTFTGDLTLSNTGNTNLFVSFSSIGDGGAISTGVGGWRRVVQYTGGSNLVLNTRRIGLGASFGSVYDGGGNPVNMFENNGIGTVTFNADMIVANSRTGTFFFGGTNASNNTFSGIIPNSTDGALSICKFGAGKWILTNDNTYTGNAVAAGGILSVAKIANATDAQPLGKGYIQLGDSWNTGNMEFTGSINTTTNKQIQLGGTDANRTGTGGIVNNGSGTLSFNNLTFNTPHAIATVTRTLTLGGSNTGANSISGTIQNNNTAGNGLLALTKSDTGTWTLGGANTYTGATAIAAGKLFINGDQSLATGNISVSANATLGGSGKLGGNTTIATNGRLEFNLSTAAASHNPLDFVTGKGITFSGASTLTITSSGGASPGSYTLITGGNNIISSVPATLVLPSGWEATVTISGNRLLLNVTSTGGTYTTPSYTSWSGDSFASTFTDTALTSNPDGDNLTNLQEFAFGLDPTISENRPLIYTEGGALTQAGQPVLAKDVSGYLAVFTRRKDHVNSGLTYAVQFSADLTQWTTSVSAPVLRTSPSASGDYEVLSIPYPSTVPVSGGGANRAPLFFRVGVSD